MHIRESDLPSDPADLEDEIRDVAKECLGRFMKRTDLDLLVHNCGQHTDSGIRAYNEAAAKPY